MFNRVKRKPLTELKTSIEVQREIDRTKNELPDYTRNLIWGIPVGTCLFLVVFPYMDGLDMDQFLNSNQLYYMMGLWTIWLAMIGAKIYKIDKSSKKRVRELKLRKEMLKNAGL